MIQIPQNIISDVRANPHKFYNMRDRATRLGMLHKQVKPHEGQVSPGQAIFSWNKKFVFLQCGRSWGKTFFLIYCAIRKALTTKYAKIYIIYPELNQAREIAWESGLLQSMIPNKYLKDQDAEHAFNKTELRVRFQNGSFIRLLGSDNPDTLRGIKPHFVGFDEYRDFKSDVYDIMEPNLGANDATLVICSTPPDREGHYTSLREFFIAERATGNHQYYYLELPTETNPLYPKERLKSSRESAIKRGEYSKFLREYMAKFVPGGANAVLPMFSENEKSIVRSPAYIDALLAPDKHKLDWYCMFDPASNTVFAVMLAAVNRHTGQIFIVDEIYERDTMKTGSVNMWHEARKLKLKHWPKLSDWTNVYDEQAAWFYNDLERYHLFEQGEVVQSTTKAQRDKMEDLSFLKDLFLEKNRVLISSRCTFTIWEFKNYTTDKHGDPIKKDDHEIDNTRYLLAASSFEPHEAPDPDIVIDEMTGLVRKKKFSEIIREHYESQHYDSPDADYAYTDEIVYLDELN